MTGITNTSLDQVYNHIREIYIGIDYWKPEFGCLGVYLNTNSNFRTDYGLDISEYGMFSIGDSFCDELDSLENEIRDNFLKLGDAKSQDNYARYLSEVFRHPIRSCIDIIEKHINTITPLYGNQPVSWLECTEEQRIIRASYLTADTLRSHTSFIEDIFVKYINIFSPNIGKNSKEEPSCINKNVTIKNLPQKILLLDKIGFFNLSEVRKLSLESKGKLVSMLCGGNADNAVDYIRHCDSDRLALEKNPYRNKTNLDVVQDLLKMLNKT